jgi:MFS family permease
MSEHVLTRDSTLLLLSTILNSIPVGYINVVPLVYLAEIGYDPATIGLIYSVSAIAVTIGLIPSGLLADRYGRKKLLIIGTLLPVVSYAIFGLTLDPLPLMIASIIGGIGFAGGLGAAMVNPSLIPMLADSTSDNKRSTLFGVLQSAWAIALTIGSALSFLPSLFSSILAQTERAAHFESYFIMSGVAAVAVIPLLFVKEGRSSRDPKSSSMSSAAVSQSTLEKRSYFSGVRSWSTIAKFSTVFAFTGFGLGVLVQLLPTWFTLRFGASESAIGLWIAVSNLVTIIAIPIIPMLVSRRGTISTAVATGITGALLLALMPFTTMFEVSAILFAIRSVAYGLSWAVLQSYMMGIVSESERATTIGFVYTTWGVGVSLGTLIGGEFLGVGLLGLPFVVAIIGYLISSAAVLVFFRGIKPPEELPPLQPASLY